MSLSAAADAVPPSPLPDAHVAAKAMWGGHLWSRVVIVDQVNVEVSRLRRPRLGEHGHARLFRDSAGGYRCEVRLAHDADEQALEHEIAHCYGWRH